jgi:DNA-directed RNA polymerase specialized sigma24 family protein
MAHGRRARPTARRAPVSSTLSREEIEDAIRSLPAAGWVRLRKIAVVYSRGGRLDDEDLLQEAFARAIDGSRNCPVHVDIVKFLAGAMQSIASDSAKARGRRPELQALPLAGETGLLFDPPDCRLNAEQEREAAQETERIKAAMLQLFADDLVAQTVAEGMMEGMEGDELRATTDLSTTGFASKRRFIRRRIDNAYPDGWPS